MDESMGNRTTMGARPAQKVSVGNRGTLRPESASLGRIDQYELLRELGGGGFGVVYLARDTVAGVDVAVKGLPPLVRNNADELERIRDNFALVSKLHHPRIAAALVLHPAKDVSYADEQVRQALRVQSGDTLMVMAYASGVTLNRWRKQFPEGKVPVAQALEVCRQIAEALDYAHAEKVVHRDVKPSNVMVETREADLSVKVLDFGLAAEIRSSMSRVSQEKGDTSGTRPYMAPEQWSGMKQNGRTDQYALAVLFYELVSGEVPFASAFDTGDPVIMTNAVENKMPELLACLSKAQNAALRKALSKDCAQRFLNCDNFVASMLGDLAYEKVAKEMARGDIKLGLMARATAESLGDDRREKALYIKYRAEQLQKELENNRCAEVEGTNQQARMAQENVLQTSEPKTPESEVQNRETNEPSSVEADDQYCETSLPKSGGADACNRELFYEMLVAVVVFVAVLIVIFFLYA